MSALRLRLTKIGNSRGIRLPAALIRRYSLDHGMRAEPQADGILLRSVRAHAGKLSSTAAARVMARANEDWSDWDVAAADGLDRTTPLSPPKLSRKGTAMPAAKLDLYKLHKAEYVAKRQPALVQTHPARYLAIAGAGRPGDATFTAQIGALYAIAFTVKMRRKFAGLQDYAIGKLEAQWLDDPATFASRDVPWRWRLLIRSPDFLKPADLATAATALLDKGKPATVKEVALTTLDEGACVQMVHVGPYDHEPESIALMQAFAADKGLAFAGPHHEIYLSDPRRVPPERLKTILRMPVKPA
jgi:antitoxin component of MazEF toxin-antitoxin module